MRQAPARLLVDLRARRLEVRAPVRRIGVLVRVEVELRPRGAERRARLADRAVGTFERIGENELGAVGRENRAAFAATRCPERRG